MINVDIVSFLSVIPGPFYANLNINIHKEESDADTRMMMMLMAHAYSLRLSLSFSFSSFFLSPCLSVPLFVSVSRSICSFSLSVMKILRVWNQKELDDFNACQIMLIFLFFFWGGTGKNSVMVFPIIPPLIVNRNCKDRNWMVCVYTRERLLVGPRKTKSKRPNIWFASDSRLWVNPEIYL